MSCHSNLYWYIKHYVTEIHVLVTRLSQSWTRHLCLGLTILFTNKITKKTLVGLGTFFSYKDLCVTVYLLKIILWCLYILSFNFSSLNTENHVTLAITPVSIIAMDSSFNYCLNHWTSWKKTVGTFITGVLFLVPIENSALTSEPNMDSFQIKCKNKSPQNPHMYYQMSTQANFDFIARKKSPKRTVSIKKIQLNVS